MFARAERTPPRVGDDMRAPTAPLAEKARSPHALSSDVFRFDSLDRERFACGAISEEEEDVFSPISLRSPGQSSLDSSFAGAGGSPIGKRAILSPMRVKEEREVIIKTELPATPMSPPRLQVVTSPCQGGSRNSAVHRAGLCACLQCSLTGDAADERSELAGMLRGASSSSPLSPLTPVSPAASSSQSQSPLPLDYQMMRVEIESQLSELYRRRSHSDSDLAAWIDPPVTSASAAAARCSVLRQGRRHAPRPLQMPGKSGSLESDHSSPQDSPLDLSLRAAAAPGGRLGAVSSPSALAPGWEASLSSAALQLTQHPLTGLRPTGVHPSVPIVRGDVASPTTRESVALRYNLEVCPVVEEMSPGNDVAYVCPVCGQMFSLHDRLAKHMASRHKSKPPDATSKAYVCDTCKRSFARSDMLTRHMRLHTGLKPYTCRACGQVFSRSDHLSTHQRTHTGEKPYKCPQCPYAACRRDMITRHMRTHARYEPGAADGGSAAAAVSSSDDSGPVASTARSNRGPPRRANSEEQPPTYLRHLSTGLKRQEAPASPGLALQSLSVQSPAPMDTGDVTAEHS